MNGNLDISKCLKTESVDPKDGFRFIGEIDNIIFYLVMSVPTKQSLRTMYGKICIEDHDPNCVSFKSFRKTDDLVDKIKIWIERSMKKIRFDHENLKKFGFEEDEKFKKYKLFLGNFLILADKYTDLTSEVRMVRKEDEGRLFVTPIIKTKSGKTLTDTIFKHFQNCDLNLLPFMNSALRDFVLGERIGSLKTTSIA